MSYSATYEQSLQKKDKLYSRLSNIKARTNRIVQGLAIIHIHKLYFFFVISFILDNLEQSGISFKS